LSKIKIHDKVKKEKKQWLFQTFPLGDDDSYWKFFHFLWKHLYRVMGESTDKERSSKYKAVGSHRNSRS
jgi:hypothetical protein